MQCGGRESLPALNKGKSMLIGIIGYSQSGKDTAWEFGLKRLGVERRAFADVLKQEVADEYGIPSQEIEEHKALWRPRLVSHGESMRQVDPDYWTKKVLTGLDGKKVAITDVRYLNEAKQILAHNGTLIYIFRPGFRAANLTEEKSIFDVHQFCKSNIMCFINDSSKEDLGKLVGNMFEGK